jgi:signal transduction histidine kinase
MDKSGLESAFNPFHSTKEGGYGLGLAVIKKKIEELGGRVEIASRLGEGTTVTLFLPAALDVGSPL